MGQHTADIIQRLESIQEDEDKVSPFDYGHEDDEWQVEEIEQMQDQFAGMRIELDEVEDQPCLAKKCAEQNPHSNVVMVACPCPMCNPRC